MSPTSRNLGIAASLLIVGFLIYTFNDIVTWLAIAWVFSLLGRPIMNLLGRIRIGKLRLNSGVRAVITIIGFYFLFYLLLALFVPPVIHQAENLSKVDYASVAKSVEEPVARWNNYLIDKGFMEGERMVLESDSLQQKLKLEEEKGDTFQIGGIDFWLDEVALKREANAPVISTQTIAIDSILTASGDTVTQTNIALDITISVPKHEEIEEAPLIDPSAVVKHTDTPLDKLQKKLYSFFNPMQMTSIFGSLLGILGNILAAISSITFILFFFLKEENLFTGSLMALVENDKESKAQKAIQRITNLLMRYFGGIVLQITVITVYIYVVLSILGIPNALLIAFFAALINVIPYLGPILGALFGMLIVVSSSLDVSFYDVTVPMLIKTVLTFLSMQLLDNLLLQPFIFSKSVKAHPLEIFIVIIVGAKLYGIIGMVLAVPLYTIFRVIASEFLSEYKLVQRLTKTINDDDD